MADQRGNLPARLHGGETLYVSFSLSDYAPGSYTLKYSFSAATPVSVDAVASGSDWTVTVPATTTILWGSGPISFVGLATSVSTGRVIAVDEGQILIIASATYTSWASAALTAIDAVLAGRATDGQSNFTIGDMSVGLMPISDLMKYREFLQGELAKTTATRVRRRMLSRFV